MDAVLDALEAGRSAVGVERDDLAVEQRRTGPRPRPTPTARGRPPGTAPVLSFPARDAIATAARFFPGTGVTVISARMPSYFGS